MQFTTVTAALAILVTGVTALDKPLNIEFQNSVPCTRKTQRGTYILPSWPLTQSVLKSISGDKVDVHYRGTLEKDGSEFDASYNRGQPLSFTVGKGQVIKGWDEGLLDMCIGDKRRLTIQPEWGYGERGMGPIPANSVLVFETELIGIGGKKVNDEL